MVTGRHDPTMNVSLFAWEVLSHSQWSAPVSAKLDGSAEAAGPLVAAVIAALARGSDLVDSAPVSWACPGGTAKRSDLVRATGYSYCSSHSRSLYSDQDLQILQELVGTVTANHFRFSYALSPGIDSCYSREADLNFAVANLEPLYSIGVPFLLATAAPPWSRGTGGRLVGPPLAVQRLCDS